MDFGNVEIEPAVNGSRLPIMLRARSPLDPLLWAQTYRNGVRDLLDEYGAVLLRGYGCTNAPLFEKIATTICGTPLPYIEQTSPRTLISNNVYTSTDHPSEQSIFLHNEQSYSVNFARYISFCCITPPADGGETPLADCRAVFERIDPSFRAELIRQRYMYVRTYRHGLGLPWATVFGTKDRLVVERYCREHDIQYEWANAGRVFKTRQVRRAAGRVPGKGTWTWFNHMTFFHFTTLPKGARDLLLQVCRSEEDLPNNTYWGNGRRLDDEVVASVRSAYELEEVAFPWHEGDVLMVDNLTTAHGRRPFVGDRKILAALCGATSWNAIPE